MGNTWGLLIPLTILMASLRHKKKGWWFQLHRALATLSLILVIIGVILGRQLRISHPPVTFAGKCHKVMGYSALAFIVIQVSCQQHFAKCMWHVHALCKVCALACGCMYVPVHILFASFFMLQSMLRMPASQLVYIVLKGFPTQKRTVDMPSTSCWLRYPPFPPFPESPAAPVV